MFFFATFFEKAAKACHPRLTRCCSGADPSPLRLTKARLRGIQDDVSLCWGLGNEPANRTEFGRDLTVVESGFESDSLRIRRGLTEGIATIARAIAVIVVIGEAVGKLGPAVETNLVTISLKIL